MKTKIKRHSRSVISVILAVCMLVSCMTVGIIATDAAKVGSEPVGFGNGDGIHLTIGSGGSEWHDMGSGDNEYEFTLASAATIKYSFSAGGQNYYKDSSLGTPTASSKSDWDWYAKKNGSSGSFSIALSAGTYKFKLKSISGNDLRYGFWKTSSEEETTPTPSPTGTTWKIYGNKWGSWSAGSGSNLTLDETTGYYILNYAVPDSGEVRFRIFDGSSKHYYPLATTESDNKGNIPVGNTWVATGNTTGTNDNYFCLENAEFRGKTVQIQWDAANERLRIYYQYTVTAETYTDDDGTYATVTVNGEASATVEPESQVSLAVTISDDTKYRFNGWKSDKKLNYAMRSNPTTSAIVLGSTTATALVSKVMYGVTTNEAENGTVAVNGTKFAWGDEVPIKVTPADGYKLGSLTVKDSNNQAIAVSDSAFTMPVSDVTISATFVNLATPAINYGDDSNGYVSVGYQAQGEEDDIANVKKISRSVADGTAVPEGSVLNFCAIPKPGYEFEGWYSDPEFNTKIEGAAECHSVTVGTTPVNRYAKFNITYAPEAGKFKFLVPTSLKTAAASMHYWSSNGSGDVETDVTKSYDYKGSNYYIATVTLPANMATDEITLHFHNGSWDPETKDISSVYANNTYVLNWDGNGKTEDGKWDAYTAPAEKRPITVNVTNRDHGTTAVSAYATVTATNIGFVATPDDHYSVAMTANGSTIATKSFDMTPTGATLNLTYTENPKYTVTFDAEGEGEVTATVGGKAITSGTEVYQGTEVVFTPKAKSGYFFSGWSGANSTKTSPLTLTINANTTLTGNFGLVDYQVVIKDNATPITMTQLPNGYWVSDKTVAATTEDNGGTMFTLYRTTDGKYVDSGATDKNWYINNSTKIAVSSKWTLSTKSTDTKDYYTNHTGAAAYVLYDPVEDKMWLSANNDGARAVTVYIKDGTVRSGQTCSSAYGVTVLDATGTTNGVAATKIADKYDSHVHKIELTEAQVRSGVKLHIKTTVNQDYIGTYYVKGFDVNGGVTQGVISQEFSDSTLLELAEYDNRAKIHGTDDAAPYNDFVLNINADSDQVIEVTPIYFPVAAKETDNVRFYAYDFTGDVKQAWGNTLAVYPYIQEKYDPYGYYPGQLMVKEGGVYYSDIPAAASDGTLVQGLTMNNYVFDDVHWDLFYGAKGQTDKNANQYQTYDYNEFQIINKIFAENDLNEDIIFSFKYKEEKTIANSNLADYIYYRDYEGYTDATRDNPDSWNAKDYRKTYNTINPDDPQYQFEDLTDAYGNRVDIIGNVVEDPVKSKYNPILIVSNGYDYSAIGRFATAWAFYKPENWTGDPGTYTLFEVMGGQGNTTNRFQSESYLINPDYEEAIIRKYTNQTNPAEILDCESIPALITYEYEGYAGLSNGNVGGGNEEKSHRSDGRWYYSRSDEPLQAHMFIEYAESNKEPFRRDYYQDNNIDYTSGDDVYNPAANTGLVTGIKAYFENEEDELVEGRPLKNIYGYTRANSVSDGNHTFDLATVGDPNGEYEFVGWFLYNGKDYEPVSTDPVHSVEARSNDIYVARYVKVPSGNLIVNHSIHPDSSGRADCFVQVDVTDGGADNANVIYSYEEVKGQIKVGPNYIKANSTNWLKITLRTEPGAYSTFSDFYYYVSSTYKELTTANMNLTDCTVSKTTSGTYTATIKLPISSLFDTPAEGEDAVQLVSSLPFYSKLGENEYFYTVKFSYTSREFGNQTYTASAKFTEEELDKYVDIDATGAPQLKNLQSLREEFLKSKAPYEDNFMQTVSWNFLPKTELNPNGVDFPSRSQTNRISINVNSIQGAISQCVGYFHLPYKWTVTGEDQTKQQLTPTDVNKDGSVNYDSGAEVYQAHTTFKNIYAVNDNMTPSEATFITAPERIKYSEDNTKYFSYWKVTTPDNTEKIIMYCYAREFNLAFFQDYVITPVYENTEPVSPTQMMINNKDVDTNDKVKIRFLENSRNQWNLGGGNLNGTDYAGWNQYGDRIYCDFVVDFNFDNTLITSYPADANVKTGIVIERVDVLAEKTVDEQTVKNTDLAAYSDIISNENQGSAGVKTYVESNFATKGERAFLNTNIDNTKIDNKNRIHHYYAFANQYAPNVTHAGEPTTLKNYLYRAYGYITYQEKYDDNGTEKTRTVTYVSDHPVYFTFYDMASIENYSQSSNAGGGQS